MKPALILAQVLSAISICWAQSPKPQARLEAEYYVVAYAQHYRVPSRWYAPLSNASRSGKHARSLPKALQD